MFVSLYMHLTNNDKVLPSQGMINFPYTFRLSSKAGSLENCISATSLPKASERFSHFMLGQWSPVAR